jgi:hypothetical protein
VVQASVDKGVITIRFMPSFRFLGLVTLAAAALQAQPSTTGTPYWSTAPMDCSAAGSQTYTIPLASGGTGYVCIVSGTFLWLAAGGSWGTSIRVSAPASGAIGVDYSFYDPSGSTLTLDSTSPNGAASGNDVNFVLKTNQPSDVNLLGAPSDAPQYAKTQTGSVYAVFYCPNATACATVLPQLLYAFSPIKPWSLSVPISWDGFFSDVQVAGAWTQWSATGINDATHFLSFVVYSQSTVASVFTVRVYDSTGSLVGQGTTPVIPGYSAVTQEGGTYGALLSQVISTPLPSGVFKVTVDGGANSSSVSFLQFSGDSAASLQVAFDTTSATTTLAAPAQRPNVRGVRVPASVHQVSGGLPK